MSFLIAGAIVVGAGTAKAISGGIQKKNAKKKAEEAQLELDKMKDQYKNLDTSNPYLNQENVYEDLTVNQEEAQFIKEQQMQQQANILQDLRGAAGSSGIAGLAQTLANQSSVNARKAAVSIGKQEQANQMKERAEAGRINQQERQGDIMSRNMEAQKTKALLGMAADERATQQKAVAAADAKMWSGIQQAASGFGGAVTQAGGMGNLLGGVGQGQGLMNNMQMTNNIGDGYLNTNNYSDPNDPYYLHTNDPNDPMFSMGPHPLNLNNNG